MDKLKTKECEDCGCEILVPFKVCGICSAMRIKVFRRSKPLEEVKQDYSDNPKED